MKRSCCSCFPGPCLLLLPGDGWGNAVLALPHLPPAFQFVVTLAEGQHFIGVFLGEFGLYVSGRLPGRLCVGQWVLWWELGHRQLPARGVLSQQYPSPDKSGAAPGLPAALPMGAGEGHRDLGMRRQSLVLISGLSDPFAGGGSSLSV